MKSIDQYIDQKAKEESDERNVARVGIVKTGNFQFPIAGVVPAGDTNWFIRTTVKNIDGNAMKRLSVF